MTDANLPTLKPSDVADMSPYFLADDSLFVVGYEDGDALPGTADGVFICSQHLSREAARRSRKRLAHSTGGRERKLKVYRVER